MGLGKKRGKLSLAAQTRRILHIGLREKKTEQVFPFPFPFFVLFPNQGKPYIFILPVT